jgi:predicted MPP superfamily phosphohydrolase
LRGALGFIGFALVLYSISALVHFAMWRWFRSVAPGFTRRRKALLLASLAVLFLLPVGRDVSILFPEVYAFRSFAAVGMLWHITVWFTMAAVGVFRATAGLIGLAGAARAALARARSNGRPELAEPVERPSNPAPACASPSRRIVLERLGGAAAFAASSGSLAWGALWGRYEWAVEEVPIRLAALPRALDGFTIVQLSDLHVGTFVGERELALGLGLLDRLRPDMVVITGDLIDVDRRFVPLAARRLGALRARYGTYCVPGNHDYYTGATAVFEGMTKAGVEVLRNRGKVIAPQDGGFALLGVDDLSAHQRGGAGPDLARARAEVPPDLATVLLAHQPRFAATAVASGIDLQLSGHTHGGQINPGFRPIDFLFPYVSGRYDVGSMQLYVNRGFGTAGPPARLGAPPEITKIVLVAG